MIPKDARRFLLAAATAAAIAILAAAIAFRSRSQLGRDFLISGWMLAALLLFLAAFNVRKRLSMIPLGSARTWLLFHAAGGLLAVALFWIHTKTLWPLGLYEQILTLCFYLVTANGIAGYILQRIYPTRLTETGLEVIYERIPEEIVSVREQTEAIVLACTRETKSDTLARHYLDTLDWFFRRPRFFASHAVGGQKARHWVDLEIDAVRRYLNAVESGYLNRLAALADLKNKLDLHYAAQTVMKGWLLFHVPFTAVLMIFMVWHILMVHVYAV